MMCLAVGRGDGEAVKVGARRRGVADALVGAVGDGDAHGVALPAAKAGAYVRWQVGC